MTKIKLSLILAAASLSLGGCAADSLGNSGFGISNYALVKADKPRKVGDGDMVVTAPRDWNRLHARLFYDVSKVEDWTLNGVLLDDMTFVTGIKDGKRLVHEQWREYRQVPRFRSNMSPQEVVAMIESLYRTKGGAVDFDVIEIAPAQFLDGPGFRYDFEHLDSDEVTRRGRGYARIIDGRLYLIQLDAAKLHYFDEALPDLESVVRSARVNR